MRNVATEIAKQYKMDISSFTKAYRMIPKQIGRTRREMETFILDVVGKPIPAVSHREVELTCGYVVQEAVKLHLAGQDPTQDAVVSIVTDKVASYVRDHSWEFVARDGVDVIMDDTFVPTRTQRAPKGSGMSKKERCVSLYVANKEKSRKELIELFVSELGLTPPGASTYVHNVKSGLWK